MKLKDLKELSFEDLSYSIFFPIFVIMLFKASKANKKVLYIAAIFHHVQFQSRSSVFILKYHLYLKLYLTFQKVLDMVLHMLLHIVH